MAYSEQETSWKSFFTGCFVILLIFGGIGGTFFYFKKKGDAEDARIETVVMRPYWDAVMANDFGKAHSLRAKSWSDKHTPGDLETAYSKAVQDHGKIKKVWLRFANRFYEPGEEQQQLRVESIYEFDDGGRYTVFFILQRAADTDPWQIGNSEVPMSLSLGDGPY